MKKLTTILAIAALAGQFTSSVDAWTYGGYWNSNNVTLRASAVSFPSGSSYRTALSTVVSSRFYNNPSEFWFTMSWNDGSVGIDNGQSEVWFTSNSSWNPAYCVRQYSWWYTNRIVEADLIFWTGQPWTSSMSKSLLWPYGGSYRPFRTTCMHEVGHAAGLNHENDEYNIMGQDWDHIHLNGSTARCYLGEDASDGLVAIYGRASGGSFEDVSVTHFEYSGASGQYSAHNFCGFRTLSNFVPLWSWFGGMPRYQVNRGQSYRVEFTYENNGETTKNGVSVGYYISTNSYISTGDRLIGTASMNLGRNDVFTWTKTLYLPSDLVRGRTYYLGVIVDRTNSIAEYDSLNNAAYHVIRIN